MVKRNAGKLPINLIGYKFGKLTVVSKGENYVSKKGKISSQWWCQCDCGSPLILVRRDGLTTGNTRSCGCLRQETCVKHHGTGTRLYQTWRNMINRCYRTDTDSYHLYGAKGIKVCEEWKNSFETFREWAYDTGYQDNLTIERKDNTKNYCPENCQWATFLEQATHTSRNHYLQYNGECYTISTWSRKLNIPPSTLRSYATKYGDAQAIAKLYEIYLKGGNN